MSCCLQALRVSFVLGAWHLFETPEAPRRPFSAKHLAFACAAAAVGWALTLVLDGAGGFFLAAFLAVGAYQLLLAAEVAVALAPRPGRTQR